MLIVPRTPHDSLPAVRAYKYSIDFGKYPQSATVLDGLAHDVCSTRCPAGDLIKEQRSTTSSASFLICDINHRRTARSDIFIYVHSERIENKNHCDLNARRSHQQSWLCAPNFKGIHTAENRRKANT
jgi:hypothetical protein